MTDRWKEYYERTKNLPPSKLLVKALNYSKSHGNALDLGAGALKDSRYLLQQNFQTVIAVDSNPSIKQTASHIDNPRLQVHISTFDDFNYEKEQYDLINAQFSLPFSNEQTFAKTWKRIKKSLAKDGIFTGQFFGEKDEWNKPGNTLIFHSKDAIIDLLSDLEVIILEEIEEDSKTANGTPKHWHYSNIIARKK